MEKLGKQLSIQDWDTMIDDFQSGPLKQEKWFLQYPGLSIFELALYHVLRKDFSLKSSLIVFLEEFADVLIKEPNIDEALGSVLDAVRVLVQSPIDGVSVTYSLKEQMMVSATSIMITTDGLHRSLRHLEGLTELLLTVINKPNHGFDRQTRAVACECLRELERAFPCLLYEICSHLWTLCQNERTHASQGYILLLTSMIHDLVCVMGNNSCPKSGVSMPSAVSILSTSVPLVPFNAPPFLVTSIPGEELDSVPTRVLTNINIKELRRVMAFLLERPQVLTPCGMLEFISMLIPVAVVLELQVSLLKVQFSGLLCSFNPILCHIVLMLYSHFPDAFDGEENEISRRLMLISKDFHQNLVFRLLSIHWLLGFESLSVKRNIRHSIVSMASSYYPSVFDPLSLKALKLDVLAYCAIRLDPSQIGLVCSSKQTEKLGLESRSFSGREDMELSVAKLFDDGLVCVSAFKWLPPWSTETTVAFRMLHKFLVAAAPNSVSDASLVKIFTDSTRFCTLQRMLVETALEFRRLVPVIVAFADRLLGCEAHHWLGECLLQTFDQNLLSKLVPDHRLASYFPVFDRIAENDSIPPQGLLELLTTFVVTLVETHGPDTGLKSWSQGSKVLGICRKMLMHHHSSRVFSVLSRLLAFTCQSFPDLEVRDSARIYLRMLVCIPGKKLRHILNLGDQLPGVSSSPQLSSFFPGQSPRPSRDIKKSLDVSSYIHFNRVVPLVVKQSWALSIPSLGIEDTRPGYFNGIGETPLPIDIGTEIEPSSGTQILTQINNLPNEPLRVTDSKIAEILEILRRHFACIPDFRNMPGLRIQIPCTIKLQSDSPYRDLGLDLSATFEDEIDKLPALYAIVISYSSSAPYGLIPSSHIPFLLGTYSRNDHDRLGHEGETSLALVDECDEAHAENGSWDEERGSTFRPLVTIELEPREPVPGLINIKIDANRENGKTIQGQLPSISVGIEDMFLKPNVPDDIPGDSVPSYHSDLFYALWEACGNSSNTGRETFPLCGAKGVVAISGTRSVKLLEIPFDHVVGAVETHLAPFVVRVLGEPLVNLVRNKGLIKDVVWKDDAENSTGDVDTSPPYFAGAPLQLEYINDEHESEGRVDMSKRNMGCFEILIFLPPRFHLLLRMDVSNISTLVRIRTDHWPYLAYIDDYLEALTSP